MRRISRLLFSLLVAGSLSSCGEPDVDKTRSEGGSAPDPTGVIEGTVLYVGPRPQCVYNGRVPVRVQGRVVLTLFEYDNPPPPTGGASSAENLLTIPGPELFPDLSDCVPEAEAEDFDPFDADEYVMRSVSFIWPEIHLDHDDDIAYQIRGFFDYDEDFNPFFSVTNLPTFGDVVGGALERLPDPGEPSTFLRIEFPSQEAAPNGVINDSPTVTLGAVVNTERPVFEITGAGGDPATALSAEAFIPGGSDSLARERTLHENTNTRLSMLPRDIGEERPEWQAALDAAGLTYSFDNEQAYAWYFDEVDADNDGAGDLHPVLGAGGGVPWITPIVIAQRAATPDEVAAGVPSVLIIGSIRPSIIVTTGLRAFYRHIDVVFAPIAAVDLDPTNTDSCRVPYIPAGNQTSTYERIPVVCHELPTGPYNVNVLHGRAGSNYLMVSSFQSETGWDINEDFGLFSGQAWSIPNPLGDPTGTAFGPPGDNQLGDPTLRISTQGPEGRLIVHDPDPTNSVGIPDPSGAPMGCEVAPNDDTMMDPDDTRAVVYMPVPDECCTPAVQAMCGLPLCEAEPLQEWEGIDADGRMVHRDNNNNGVLDCVPFLPPTTCCE